jgi:hypothetical protein
MGIPYKPEDKYKGLNGKELQRPEFPMNIKCC